MGLSLYRYYIKLDGSWLIQFEIRPYLAKLNLTLGGRINNLKFPFTKLYTAVSGFCLRSHPFSAGEDR